MDAANYWQNVRDRDDGALPLASSPCWMERSRSPVLRAAFPSRTTARQSASPYRAHRSSSSASISLKKYRDSSGDRPRSLSGGADGEMSMGMRKVHIAAMTRALGVGFDELSMAEKTRRVLVFTRFLARLMESELVGLQQQREEESPPSTSCANVVADALCATIAKHGVLLRLGLLCAHDPVTAKLVLMCFANLISLGCCGALAEEVAVRTAVCDALSCSDATVAEFALPCAHGLRLQSPFVRTLCASSARVTPALVRLAGNWWDLEAARCATSVLAAMRLFRDALQSRSAVGVVLAASEHTRVAAWLHRARRSLAAANSGKRHTGRSVCAASVVSV